MTDNTPEELEDDGFPPVHFTLRNPSGEDGEITLRTAMLGMDLYVLITPGEDGPNVEASHVDFESLGFTLSLVLAALLVSEEIPEDSKAQIRDLIAEAEPAEEEA